MPVRLPSDRRTISAAVVKAAMAMPTMPNRLPRIDVVGWLRPFKAWMKQTDAIRYISVTVFMLMMWPPRSSLRVLAAPRGGLACLKRFCAALIWRSFSAGALRSFFLNISSMRRVTKKPPKTLTAASATANTPMVLPSGVSVSAAASMAPTMTMAEMALVTAISGVCSAGVTVQTT
jgi:hypothetical protein